MGDIGERTLHGKGGGPQASDISPELGEGSGQLSLGDCAELLSSKEAEGTWASLWGPPGIQPRPSYTSHHVLLCTPFSMS